jgi:hypothetical protein
MKAEDRDEAARIIRYAYGQTEAVILHDLCEHFHLVPRRVMKGHTPGVLRELGEIFEREHRFDLAIWLNALADATED